MAVIKAADIVNYVVKAKNAGWGYVFGGQGQIYTRALAEKWAAAKKSGRGYDYYVVRCSRWFGKIIVDCSGLVIEAYRSQIPKYGDKTANTIYSKSVQKGKLSSIPEIPGLCVWRSGHIGIYIGNGKVIESGGSTVGVVLSKLNAPATNKKWTNWGRMADVDYSNPSTPSEPDPPSAWLGRYLRLAAPYLNGDDVAQVQMALRDKGYDPGTIDGIYGPYTERAVKAFQTANKLEVDGIVGEETTAALFADWVTDPEGNPVPPWTENQLSAFRLGRLLKLASPYMSGDDVTDVQDALALNNFSPGPSDGEFGPKTQSAVIGFQKKKGLVADGIVGVVTTNMLGGIWTGD
jgi:peptidoglycan hydrolase-like protein with peptidoglycan-binding domain